MKRAGSLFIADYLYKRQTRLLTSIAIDTTATALPKALFAASMKASFSLVRALMAL
jgi:hypothetical protein